MIDRRFCFLLSNVSQFIVVGNVFVSVLKISAGFVKIQLLLEYTVSIEGVEIELMTVMDLQVVI